MKFNTLFTAIAVSFLSTACSDVRTTETGIKVTILEKGEGIVLKDSTILQLNMSYTNSNDNEQWNSAKAGGPATIQYNDSIWGISGDMYEALEVLQVGDSATFEISAKDLFENTFKAVLPDSIDSVSNMTFNVRLLSMRTAEEFQVFQKEEYERSQKEAQALRIEAEKKRLEVAAETIKKDGETIDKYLADKGITAQTTESGIRYVITQEGAGSNAVSGNNVSVHYNGTLLDGTKFDSSYDRGSPFGFVLGQGRVIAGWDEGITLLNKGAKATLYIPSSLAYGEREQGAIVANSILIFDVELVDYK